MVPGRSDAEKAEQVTIQESPQETGSLPDQPKDHPGAGSASMRVGWRRRLALGLSTGQGLPAECQPDQIRSATALRPRTIRSKSPLFAGAAAVRFVA